MAGLQIDDGWLWLYNQAKTDWVKVKCDSIEYDMIWDFTGNHYPGGEGYSFDIEKHWYVFKIKKIYFSEESVKNTFLSYLLSWQTGDGMHLRIQRNEAVAYEKFDGTNTTAPVRTFGPKKVRKIENQNGETYVIGTIIFESYGPLTA